jgi:hypothetical protein
MTMTQTQTRKARPSRAVTNGSTTGTVLGSLVMLGLNAVGVPLPADPATAAVLGSVVGNLVGHATAWLTRGGRKGEAD